MVFCPECNKDWDIDKETCPICQGPLKEKKEDMTTEGWVILGYVEDKVHADFAKEVLDSSNIPVTVVSKSGFLGQTGMILGGFYKPDVNNFHIMVPVQFVEEAEGILTATLGDAWRKKDS
jgi:hypothetical protein